MKKLVNSFILSLFTFQAVETWYRYRIDSVSTAWQRISQARLPRRSSQLDNLGSLPWRLRGLSCSFPAQPAVTSSLACLNANAPFYPELILYHCCNNIRNGIIWIRDAKLRHEEMHLIAHLDSGAFVWECSQFRRCCECNYPLRNRLRWGMM